MIEADINTMHEYVDNHNETLDNELQALLRKACSRLIGENDQLYQPTIQRLERKLAEQNVKNATEK